MVKIYRETLPQQAPTDEATLFPVVQSVTRALSPKPCYSATEPRNEEGIRHIATLIVTLTGTLFLVSAR